MRPAGRPTAPNGARMTIEREASWKTDPRMLEEIKIANPSSQSLFANHPQHASTPGCRAWKLTVSANLAFDERAGELHCRDASVSGASGCYPEQHLNFSTIFAHIFQGAFLDAPETLDKGREHRNGDADRDGDCWTSSTTTVWRDFIVDHCCCQSTLLVGIRSTTSSSFTRKAKHRDSCMARGTALLLILRNSSMRA